MKIRDEKGSMAAYVTIVLVSMLFILMAVFLTSNNLRKNQIKTALKVKETYEADNSRADEIYDGLVGNIKHNYSYIQDFNTPVEYQTSNTTYKIENGLIKLTATGNDSQVKMYNVTSFDPKEYRYVDIRYKIKSEQKFMEIFFIEEPVDQTYSISKGIISDGQWHVLTIDLWENENVKNRDNITGWRLDWIGDNNAYMEVDYIRIRK